MRTIGIRVSPKKVFYTVCEFESQENTFSILTTENIVVPLSLDVPDTLSYIRTTMFSIINEFQIGLAGIRTMETNTQSGISIERAYIEGVIQELISNCCVAKYFAGKKSCMASLLHIRVEQVSAYIDGNDNFLDIVNWLSIGKEYRECIICAYAALALGGVSN